MGEEAFLIALSFKAPSLSIQAPLKLLLLHGHIPGLYAAGEIAGGVHGNNRLGGNPSERLALLKS